MNAFRFYSPLWFILSPLAIAAVWYAWHPRRRAAAVFSSLQDLKSLPVTMAQRVRKTLPFFYGLGLVLIIGALARPQQGRSESRKSTEGIAIELVIDVSGSMKAIDFQLQGENISRLSAVKHVVSQFVEGSKESGLPGRHSDLVGLVAFGGFADSKCPLTLDHGALLDIVRTLEIPKPIRDRRGNIINQDTLREELATAIGDGVSLAVDRLRGVTAKSKVVILLTDGDSNAGVIEPREAANIAKELGIKVYSIGIGTNGEVWVPEEDAFGQTVMQRAMFRIDEKLLKDIADTTGARYFHASSTEALTQVYAEIDKMEKSKVEESMYTEYTELYLWLALPGIALVLSVGFLSATRFRALP
jgi:Ca-activated chloride channel family protein